MKKRSLRIEKSINYSGNLIDKQIPLLREKDYDVIDISLDGDAPKEFIKIYEYKPNSGIKRKNPSTWTPYIAKTGEKWYPHESVIEYMINRIGQVLGFNMNEIRLYRINGQIRFLSRYFIRQKLESLTHGAEICGEYLNDRPLAEEIANDPKSSRELFTFEFICQAITHKFGSESHDILIELVKLITFDALVGNNDRHFYNWGVIVPKKKGLEKPRLSPIYDSARGFLWNLNENTIIKYSESRKSNGKQFVRYLENACPRISIEGNHEVNHFDFIQHLKDIDSKKYKSTIETYCTHVQEAKVYEMLKQEFFPMFSSVRSEMILQIVQERFERIRKV